MNGIEQVKNALAKKLAEGGITAVDAWSRRGLPQLEKAVAVLGIQETESDTASMWNYLGDVWDETLGHPVERYGRRLQLKLFVDFYAPKGCAKDIEAGCERLEELFLTPLVEGIQGNSVQRGELSYDRTSGYLKCRCTVMCLAYFTATRAEENALLTDFTLKGVLQ